MNPLLARVESALSGLDLVRRVDAVPRGHVRISTKLTFQDGSGVVLFVARNAASDEPGSPSFLTDFGKTLAMQSGRDLGPDLFTLGDPEITDIANYHGATLVDDRLELVVQTGGGLGDAVLTIGLACIHVHAAMETRRAVREAEAAGQGG